MNLKIRGKIQATVGVSTLLMVLTIVMVEKNATELAQLQTKMKFNQEVQTRYLDLLNIVVDMETGIRGYLLASEASYLEPFSNSEENFDKSYDDFKEFVKDKPEQLKHLSGIASAKSSWIEKSAMSTMMAKKKSSRGIITEEEFHKIFLKDNGKEDIDKIRITIRKIFSDGQSKIETQRKAVAVLANATNLLIRYALIGASLIGSFLLFLLATSISRRLNASMSSIHKFAAGDLKLDFDGSSSDEIGMINKSLGNTIGDLKDLFGTNHVDWNEMGDLKKVLDQSLREAKRDKEQAELDRKEAKEALATADEQKSLAAKAKGKADKALKLADEQKSLAETSSAEAEEASQQAAKQQKDAEKSKKEAQVAQAEAKQSNLDAQKSLADANDQKLKAESATQEAETAHQKANKALLLAQEEKDNAAKANSEAQEAKIAAEEAGRLAETEKVSAEAARKEAQVAQAEAKQEKSQADQARVIAQTSKEEADKALDLAEIEKSNALISSNKAKEALKMAENERVTASEATKSAKLSNLEAQKALTEAKEQKIKTNLASQEAKASQQKANEALVLAQEEKDNAARANGEAQEAKIAAEEAGRLAETEKESAQEARQEAILAKDAAEIAKKQADDAKVQVQSLVVEKDKANDVLKEKVNDILAVVNLASTGDLTAELSISGDDPVDMVAKGLKDFFDTIGNSLHQIDLASVQLEEVSDLLQTNGDKLSSNSKETKTNSEEASGRCTQVNSGINTLAASMEEMEVSIRGIADICTRADKITVEVSNNSKDVTSKIKELNESSIDIGGVLKLINSIAEQTNLLALNATIEAARAGESGAGFAVVAREVKELAKETATASQEIGVKISKIQNDSGHAASAISKITTSLEQIFQNSNSIASSIKEQANTTGDVSRIVVESAGSMNNITSIIKEVNQASDSTASAVQENNHSVTTLHNVSLELKELVSLFTLPQRTKEDHLRKAS